MESVHSMASSSSSSVPSSEHTSHFVSQTEMEMESAKASHWSQVAYSTSNSEWSAETNFNDFALLKKNPLWGRFFKDFEALEVGEKISGGAQADIYEARNKRDGPYNLVVKVMKGDAPLKAFQAQWPIGMLSASSLITILGGTVLRDQRLRGRFAFVMFRRWGDLRLLIDRRMKQERSIPGPFPLDKAIHLMLSIAGDMQTLHDKHDIIHRDLKASNVLVWGGFGKDISIIPPLGKVEWIGSLVADFECSVGVLGTGFWRAPEILEQVKARVPSSKVQFTRASDVYSYGMICYEIVTGCIPYDGLGGEDTISQILQGGRPELPHELPEFVRDIIVGCWRSDPSERPSFSDIYEALMLKRGPYLVSVIIDNKFERAASIVKVEQWNSPQALTLLEVMQNLMDMDLSVLKASDSSSTTMISQYFEVTDCQGRKVVDDKSIANITKVLKSLSCQVLEKKEQIDSKTSNLEWDDEGISKMEWDDESISNIKNIDGNTIVGTHDLEDENINGNTNVQMHVLELVAKRSAFLLGDLSRLLVTTNFRVHSAGCWIREGRVQCVVYVEGTRMDSFLWELRHNMEYFPKSLGRFKIIVHKVATGELFHVNRHLLDLKSMDMTRPRSSSNIRVHQTIHHKRGFWHGFRSSQVVVRLEKGCWLEDVSCKLVDMDYKIVRASIEYPYEFLKGRGNKSEEIYMRTLGKDESKNMIHRILDIGIEHGCHEGTKELIVSGPSQKLHDDLMRSLRENDLIVIGGQVYRKAWKFGTRQSSSGGSIEFFVSEKPTTRTH